jgi:quinol monooxygenase YgiN
MKLTALILASAAMVTAATPFANAQAPAVPNPNAPMYVVSYIDVLPSMKAQAMTFLKQTRANCAKATGNLRCEIVQRMEQQNEFARLEVWKDQAAFKAHAAGGGARFNEKLKPMLASPYDERILTAMSALAPQAAPGGRIVYAITHIDVIPPSIGPALPLLSKMADDGRKDTGNGRLEVLQQLAPAANHFTVVEIWSNKRQLEAHQASPQTIRFREQLQPAIGAPYDERLYKVLD